MHEKTKTYEPIPIGFRKVAHQPAKNSGPFHWLQRLYGGSLTTTIDFLLPNQRVELMQCGRFWVANRLMATPVNDMECRIDFSAFWHGLNWVPFGKVNFRTLTKMFLGQDEVAMKNLASGVLASLRGSTYRSVRPFTSSLAAALLAAFLSILPGVLALP